MASTITHLKSLPTALTAVLALLAAGCSSTPPKPSGFLSSYAGLQKVNNSTWESMNTSLLAQASRFTITTVAVINDEKYSPDMTPQDRERLAGEFRSRLIKALGPRCVPPGAEAAGGVPGIHAAITRAYPMGSSIGLGLEAEIVDSKTGQQLAAVMGFRVSMPDMMLPPEFNLNQGLPQEQYTLMPSWWLRPEVYQMLEGWSGGLERFLSQHAAR